jgi:hypothetical protein
MRSFEEGVVAYCRKELERIVYSVDARIFF